MMSKIIMAEEMELSDYINTHELQKMKATSTPVDGAEKSERRLFRLGVLTLALLCIIQATLNLSLRLALHSKANVDPFAFNGSIVDFCQNEQLQQNSTQLSFCCNNLLRLRRENQELKRERDRLREKIQELGRDMDTNDDNSGSGVMYLDDEF